MKVQEVSKGAVLIQKKIISSMYNQKAAEEFFTSSLCNNLPTSTKLY